MEVKIGKDIAEQILAGIYRDLGIDQTAIDEDGKSTYTKLINAIMFDRLEYSDSIFRLKLISPVVMGDKEVSTLEISEPSGADLREMASVKNKSDDVGKAMAVLGSVTGLGLPVINKLKSRDMMVAVSVVSLFL